MDASRKIRLIGTLTVLLLWLPSAQALLNLDGSRNQVFVFGGATFGYSSNIFAEASGRADYTVTARAGMELKRRAGIIAVNATAKFDYVRYGKYTGESGLNPSFSLELDKTTGRTTGALTINAYRENRSDSAVNLRTSSWNFPIGLNLKYPINDKFYLTSGTGYLRRTYSDNKALVNYTDYSEAVDLYYVYTSKLDLLGGYRLRVGKTTADGQSVDHWFNVGATGGLFSKMSGTVRIGYQLRSVEKPKSEKFHHYNALASVSWPITRKLALGGQISRDFNTIATGSSVDSTSTGLHATYAYSRKIEFNGGVSAGRNRFLGVNQGNRVDTFFSWDVGAAYRMNDHLTVAASYTYLRNWSSLAFSDFTNNGFSLDISSRY